MPLERRYRRREHGFLDVIRVAACEHGRGVDVSRRANGPGCGHHGAHSPEHDRARDSDDYVLAGGVGARHPWRGLTLEVRFDPRPDVKGRTTDDPADYVFTGITLSP